MEDMEYIKASVKENFTVSSTNASTKAFMEGMDAFAEIMEASMEAKVNSMEA